MISFFAEEVDFTLPQESLFGTWLNSVAEKEHHQILELNYIFCDDEYLLQINREYLAHDYYTDVITFDNSEDAGSIEGDIFISVDRLEENAGQFEIPFEHELSRVMVHGLLHLLGYSDHTDEEKQEMRKKEEAYLSLQKQILQQ